MVHRKNLIGEHSRYPRYRGALPNPDAIGMASYNGRAPHVVIYLYVENNQIRESRFQASGCAFAVACGSALSEMLRGKSVDDCTHLGPQDLASALGTIPPNKMFCAEITIHALQNALADLIRQDAVGP